MLCDITLSEIVMIDSIRIQKFLVTTVLAAVSLGSMAAEAVFTAKAIQVTQPTAPSRPEGIKTGAVFFGSIRNTGATADKMVSARSAVAERVELHRMVMDGSMMRMREVPEILLPPGEGPSFQQGKADAYHLMLINLKQPLKEGDRFAVTVRFQNAGELEIMVTVQKPGGMSAGHGGHHKH
ncbi:MAG: copper chaperone PCu(A)C [Burkholderiaceae bacterium]